MIFVLIYLIGLVLTFVLGVAIGNSKSFGPPNGLRDSDWEPIVLASLLWPLAIVATCLFGIFWALVWVAKKLSWIIDEIFSSRENIPK